LMESLQAIPIFAQRVFFASGHSGFFPPVERISGRGSGERCPGREFVFHKGLSHLFESEGGARSWVDGREKGLRRSSKRA
jgi:hypothetical protein